MAEIVFLVIAALAVFQFHESRKFYELGMEYDGAWRLVIGIILSFVAMTFALGWFLG